MHCPVARGPRHAVDGRDLRLRLEGCQKVI
jgi:hypothetical protein